MAGWQGMPSSVLVLLRKILSAFGSPESSTHQVEPGRGLCPLHQTGNAKAAAGREELVSPIGAKREDLGHLFSLPGSAQPLSIMMAWQSPSQS